MISFFSQNALTVDKCLSGFVIDGGVLHIALVSHEVLLQA